MQKHERVALKTVRGVARGYGVDVSVMQGTRHLQIVLRLGGEWRKLMVASSPRSDVTAQRNFARQHAERICRALALNQGRGHALGEAA